jgi:dTDP-4-amino-4,6-dideoxygalactose transaminase
VRDRLVLQLGEDGIGAIFHCVPLHSSPAGRRFGRVHGSMTHKDSLSWRLLRLPLWVGIDEEIGWVIDRARFNLR